MGLVSADVEPDPPLFSYAERGPCYGCDQAARCAAELRACSQFALFVNAASAPALAGSPNCRDHCAIFRAVRSAQQTINASATPRRVKVLVPLAERGSRTSWRGFAENVALFRLIHGLSIPSGSASDTH